MMENHDDNLIEWLNTLSGGEVHGLDKNEVQTLRKMIIADETLQKKEFRESLIPDDQALSALLFRLRRERLIMRKPFVPWVLAMAASLSCLTLGLTIFYTSIQNEQQVYSQPPVWRGSIHEYNVINPQARKKAEEVAKDLQLLGMQADIYLLNNVYIVETELTSPIPNSVYQLFDELGIKVEEGRVRLNIKP